MSASEDARSADIAELVPGLYGDKLAEAVQLWCYWFGVTNSPLDATAEQWSAFLAAIHRGDDSESVRV